MQILVPCDTRMSQVHSQTCIYRSKYWVDIYIKIFQKSSFIEILRFCFYKFESGIIPIKQNNGASLSSLSC